jgi:hypothetical protein
MQTMCWTIRVWYQTKTSIQENETTCQWVASLPQAEWMPRKGQVDATEALWFLLQIDQMVMGC